MSAYTALVVAFFFAKDKAAYANTIIKGMGNKDTIIPIVCWIFAGVFATVLRTLGIAEGIVGVAASVGVKGTAFIVVTFISAAIFSTVTNTGFWYDCYLHGRFIPSWISIRRHPALLASAIIS